MEVFRQFRDQWRNGCGEHQRAAIFGRFRQNELEVLTEPEVEHFVRFVQDNSACHCEVERVALDVVANTAWCADDDVRTTFESTTFVARVHTTNSGCNHGTRFRVEPFKLAADLECKFAGWRNDQRDREASATSRAVIVQKVGCDSEAKANCFARTSTSGNQKVFPLVFGI